MVIFLYGQDTFRSRQKLREIIERYKAIHQSGLNLQFLDLTKDDFQDFKQALETSAMFKEKKLIILEGVFGCSEEDKILDYLKNSNLKEDKEKVVVFFELGNPDDKKALFKELTKKPIMFQNFSLLENVRLQNWIKKQIEQRGGTIESAALRKMIAYIGNNLWQMDNEINKLIAFKLGKKINESDVDFLIKSKIETNIFRTIDALGQNNKRLAINLIHQHLAQGENELYLLSMITYQFRNLIRLKDLAERGVPYYSLAKKTGLHPFVLQKSWQQIRNFTLEQLKKIYQRLLETEIAIKTGKIESRTALEMLVMEI